MSNRRFFSGNSIDQAVLKAARHYQLEPDKLAYQVVEKKHGFIKQRRGVVIDVDPNALTATETEAAPTPQPAAPTPEAPSAPQTPTPPAPTPMAPAPQPAESPAASHPAPAPQPPEAPERPEQPEQPERPEQPELEVPAFTSSSPNVDDLPLAQGEAAEAAHHAVSTMIRLVGGEVDARILQADERLEILIEGEDTDLYTAEHGEVLTAIQFLVPRIVRGITGESVHCRVDSDGFHEEREEDLYHLAWRIAQKVDRTERSETLRPMPPDERRIIHMALADNDRVSTHSVGHGLYKRVAIRPA